MRRRDDMTALRLVALALGYVALCALVGRAAGECA
jgi:hypothetical protein